MATVFVYPQECLSCGTVFKLPQWDDRLPTHPSLARPLEACAGSPSTGKGLPAEPVPS